jgi:predicted RNase H-like HicB family nuclease
MLFLVVDGIIIARLHQEQIIMKANINLDIKVEFIKKDDIYIAYADIFGAYGMGETKSKAQQSLKESINIYMQEYLKLGVLFDKLKQEGFKKKIVLPKSSKNKTYKKLNYDIPLSNYGKEKRQYA